MTSPDQRIYKRRFSAELEIVESSDETLHLDAVLSLQAEFNLQSQLQQASNGQLKYGFLLSGYSREDFNKLLGLGGRLFLARTNEGKIVGYRLVTPGTSFSDRHPDTQTKWYESTEAKTKSDFANGNFLYLDQTCITREHQGTDLAKALHASVLEVLRPPMALAAVVESPWRNDRSQHFFRKLGYADVGTFFTPNYRGNQNLESLIFARRFDLAALTF